MDISSFASVIGALGIGSFAGQYLIGAQQRRQLRGEVVRCLAACESARWAGEDPSPPFVESIRELETAALLARIPRKAVAHYKLVAYMAWWASTDDFESAPHLEESGGIPIDLADLVRSSAEVLNEAAWSPWIARIALNHRIEERRKRAEKINPNSYARATRHLGGKSLPARRDVPIPPSPPPHVDDPDSDTPAA